MTKGKTMGSARASNVLSVALFFIALVEYNVAEGQTISPSIQVHPNPSMQQFETSIATHPSNPNIVLIGAVTQDPLSVDVNAGTMGWYYTTDAGVTWSGRDTLPTHSNLGQWMGDPSVGIDASGKMLLAGLYNDATVFVDRSSNGGAAWTHTVAYDITRGQHTPSLAIDLSPQSPFMNNVYLVSAGVEFSRSTNGGASFSTPVNISGGIGSWRRVFPRITVGVDGTVYATWPGYDAPSGTPVRLGFNRSTDGGTTWGTAKSIRSYKGVYGQYAIKGTQIYSGPSIAVDRSGGPRQGWIYITHAEKNPLRPDIFLIRSTDGGTTWSDSVKVNQDASGNDHWLPSVAVDQATGALYIVYYDSRNFPANDSAQITVSWSDDGGYTFADTLVSDTPFRPAPILAPWDDDYMGQYISIAALQNIVWPCWMDNRTGAHQVYVTRMEFSYPIISNVEAQDGALPNTFLMQNYPNPFNPSTTIRFTLHTSLFTVLAIYDVLGREVATLVNEKLDPGTHSVTWDAAGFPGGVYFYRLQAEEFANTKKLLLLR